MAGYAQNSAEHSRTTIIMIPQAQPRMAEIGACTHHMISFGMIRSASSSYKLSKVIVI
jgi:hypothetical protein